MHVSPLDSWLASQPTEEGARAYDAITHGVGLSDASARHDRLLISGDDRIEFIQGLCSNDLELMAVGDSREAAFITPKGKLIADARITKLDDALLLEAEAGRAAALDEQLSKYRIHEKAEWADASEDLAALELWGPKAAEALGESALPEGTSKAVVFGEHAFIAVGTVFGAILYIPGGVVAEVAEKLRLRVTCLVSPAVIEARRIALGLGRYGRDWDENTNPLEAGLERAINYKKGCYVGQEVVAKATYIGRTSRRLVRLEWTGAPVPPGTTLLGGKAPGRVTSSAAIPGTEQVVAFGVVRRDASAIDTTHQVGEGGPQARVVGYPYASPADKA